jgi:Ca2+-binding RTX toxin-like protein
MTYFEPKTYELQSENQPWSYATDGVNQRFEVRSGDNWTWDGTAKERSEIASYKKLAFDQTYTISYKFMVEPGQTNSADWLLVGQVHQTEDPGEPGISPPLAIEMAGERLRIVARSNPEATSSWATTTTKTLWSDAAALERGRWYDMKLEVRFDPFGGGLLNVWRDGQKIVSYAGAIGYNDQVGTYWKQGVYREAAAETFAANFSGLSITEGTTAPTDPSPPKADPVPTPPQDDSPSIIAPGGDDFLDGTRGADRLVGGIGDDTYAIDHVGDEVVERPGEGTDTTNAHISLVLSDNVENLILMGTTPINGTGNALDNTINGNEANNVIRGVSGDDKLRGNRGNDTINGGSGDDYISGGAGNDRLSGNGGSDQVYGGDGADVFAFRSIADFGPAGALDRVERFSAREGDKIDLSGLDFGATSRDRSLTWIGLEEFGGVAGELRVVRLNSTEWLVESDINGDKAADFQFIVDSAAALTRTDFLL